MSDNIIDIIDEHIYKLKNDMMYCSGIQDSDICNIIDECLYKLKEDIIFYNNMKDANYIDCKNTIEIVTRELSHKTKDLQSAIIKIEYLQDDNDNKYRRLNEVRNLLNIEKNKILNDKVKDRINEIMGLDIVNSLTDYSISPDIISHSIYLELKKKYNKKCIFTKCIT